MATPTRNPETISAKRQIGALTEQLKQAGREYWRMRHSLTLEAKLRASAVLEASYRLARAEHELSERRTARERDNCHDSPERARIRAERASGNDPT